MKTIFFLSFALVTLVSSQKLVLVGGALADDNAEVYSKIVQLATSSSTSYIGIVTAASADEDAANNGQFYVNIFKQYGAVNVEWIPLQLNNSKVASDQKWVDKVNLMTGMFFGGGDQMRLIQLFYDKNHNETPLFTAIRKNFESGKIVVAGSSAGTAVQQAAPMVTGGESYYGLRYGVQDSLDPKGDKVSYLGVGGFGFFKFNMFLDTHFSCRGRDGRMISLLRDLSSKYNVYKGVGVDENTALVVEGNVGLILGANGASFFDARNSKTLSDKSIENVRFTFLESGDRIDLNTLQVLSYKNTKKNIAGQERYDYPFSTTYDIFSSPDDVKDGSRKYPDEFKLAAQDLFDSGKSTSTSGYSYETNPSFQVILTKESTSKAFFEGTKSSSISFENLRVDIYKSTKLDDFKNYLAEIIEIAQKAFNTLIN